MVSESKAKKISRLLSGFFQSAGGARPDGDDLRLDDAIERGLGDAVKANYGHFPPEWRLSKNARRKDRKAKRE
jgi:hypothetical protein